MFESLLGMGSRGQVNFPDSGPGSKNLIYGNEQLGYFGTLTQAEFTSLGAIRNLVGLYAGTDEGAAFLWVKMFYKGRVLYFPTNTIAYNLSWNQLYNAGVVYGVDGNGYAPTATPTNQFKIMNIGKDVLKIRLFTADTNPDPTSFLSQQLLTSGGANITGSEWVQMIYALVGNAPVAYNGPKWNLFSSNSFGWGGRKVHTQRTMSNTVNNNQSVDNVYSYATPKTDLGYWLPIFELIPGNELPLLPYINLAAQADPLLPVATTEIVQDIGLMKYRASISTVVIHEAPVVTDVVFSPDVLKIKRTEVQIETTPLVSPTVTDFVYS